jgi:hypothetical protein
MPQRAKEMKFWMLGALLLCPAAWSQPLAELEAGVVFSGRNEVRVPGDTGTQFSLVDDLTTDPALYGRLRLGWDWGRHRVSALAAPVRLWAEGSVGRPILFAGQTFAPGTELRARYQFDTYRLSYRYLIIAGEQFQLGVGATGLLRDAEVRLEGDGTAVSKTDVGFVPLLRVELRYLVDQFVAFAIDAEGLVGPQGRAFDVLGAVEFPAWDLITPYVGYRFIEGGADVDEVYSFAWLHFAAIGLRVEL